MGHTTLGPRHSLPDDKGMYAAVIDPVNGYAYFVGSYLFKLDVTGDLPVQVGPAIYTGQFTQGAIDVATHYGYFPKTTLVRYDLGVGTNAVTGAGSLSLSAGNASCLALDDSDSNPANHYAYVLCTAAGNPARVAKVALSTFTELGSVTLQPGETNFLLGTLSDAKKGYAYFVTVPGASVSPKVLKIKMTAGTNPPVRIGAADLGTIGEFIDGASIDPVHGFAYYGSYNSDTNILSKVYKVRLEEGDVPPTLVGSVNLLPGEGRLAASVLDPANGFVYFANDNSYPGGVYQLSLNGTNVPIEVGFLPFPGGPQVPPPNGITANNTTTNADGILPYGEVFLRSAVFDPVRGYAYFGQDSRPNQVVKVRLAQLEPVTVAGARVPGSESIQFSFGNARGATFHALTSSDLTLPMNGWTDLGAVTEIAPGQFQFTDSLGSEIQRFYRVFVP
ncbi:MAG TPA: hypothetical protein VFE51_14555 [Verrucomicrobiae bacterium]|nr:hypothetical protein [Verrucomicrobiae bacterium]